LRLFPSPAPGASTSPEQPPPSRDQLRSRRKWPVRARSIAMKRLSKVEMDRSRALERAEEKVAPVSDIERPRTRADCKDGPRPCPWVSCEHHLYLDVSAKTGSIKLNFPNLEPHEMKDSCALDVAGQDGATLERVAESMNLTRERVRQIEVRA